MCTSVCCYSAETTDCFDERRGKSCGPGLLTFHGVTIPDPQRLVDDWEDENVGMPKWPPIMYVDMAAYLLDKDQKALLTRLLNDYKATEAHDDDGLPHTLEHLVFMGSEDYPYKGVLDLLANRCLASGTNAWTETDHTCYTMTTAGSEGFLNLLPIYLDHVLYPTLTESSYVTEVHHINGKGDDAGVVYCEMQARENDGESRVTLAMLRAMYPGHCGYKSETGGMMQNLRTSTSHEKVCKYHREFYRPENLSIIITGQVQPEQALKVLKTFEDKIISKGERPPFTRPWLDVVPGLQLSMDEVVPYPSDEEDHGLVYIAWRGPLAKEQYKLSAIMMMMEYLTDTAVAPLQRDFVEIEEPYCNMVGYSIIENSESCFYVNFDNVEKERLPEIKSKLLELLQNIATEVEKIDMKRMHNVVHRRILEAMDHIEDAPHDTIAFHAIGDLLYGETMEDMDMRLNEIKNFRKLDKEPHTFWLELLKEYCINKNCVTIIGIPNKTEMEEMGETEKTRVAEQAKTLGKVGLNEKKTALKKATEDNETEPPEGLLTSVDVPNVDCIRFHSISSSHNHDTTAANNNAAFPLADIPFSFQLDDIQTNFVTMSVVMDTGYITEELRPYLPLYVEAILESPIQRDGVIIGYEEVISELAADTVYNCASLGIDGCRFICGNFAQAACLVLKVEVEKYQKGIQWLRELLFQVQFTAERLKIIAQKMISDVARLKRKGGVMLKTLFTNMLYNKHSNKHAASMLRQHKFLTALLKKLEDPHQGMKVLEQMQEVQKVLSMPSRIHVHVAAQVNLLVQHTDKPHLSWQENFLLQDMSTQREKMVIKRANEFLYSNDESPGSGFIVGVGSVESNFLMQCVPCLTDYDHPDLVAIDLYIQYLTQLEGPMWRQIRGLGLSYHYSMYANPESGLLIFLLHKSTHVVDALVQAKQIVDGFVSGSTPLSDVELEAAKSSLIFEVIEKEKTPAHASGESMMNYFRNVNQDYNRRFIQQVPKVTVEDLKRVGSTYIAPLFDVTKSKVATCCHPTKVDEITADLKKIAYEHQIGSDVTLDIIASVHQASPKYTEGIFSKSILTTPGEQMR